jgi:pimeloyl-ACP methyl ester carboxylesterase
MRLGSTRGEGRSPYTNFTSFHYDDFTRDAIALLDHLQIPVVAVVGWSDGAIVGLDLAMNYSSRIERVFAHGANIQANMSIPGQDDPIINSKSGSLESDFETNGTTFSVNTRRGLESSNPGADIDTYTCETLSPLPEKCDAMNEGIAT